MPTVEWLGQTARDDDNQQFGSERLINLYRERYSNGFIIKSVLGMEDYSTLSGVFMRNMKTVQGTLYAACGGMLYRILDGGAVNDLGAITDASDTVIEANNGALTITAGGTFYHMDTSDVITTPSLGAFSSVGSVAFLGQRTIVTEKDGRRFQWSDTADATTWNGLNFATAESRDDNIVRAVAVNNQLWIFGERSIERWYLSGSSDETAFLQPISGAVIDIGLKSFGLLAQFPNGVMFVGDDGITYLAAGDGVRPISTRGVETSIGDSNPTNCFYFEDEGHKFCVLRFSDRPAWVYDLSMNEWHERAETEKYTAWSAVASAEAYNKSFVGTDLGGIKSLERTNKDGSDTLWRRAISATLEVEGKRFKVPKMEIRPLKGRSTITFAANIVLGANEGATLEDGNGNEIYVGEDGTAKRPPVLMLRMSRDRGETWGHERQVDAGKEGEYDLVVNVRRLGQFRRLTAELVMTDPVDVPIESTAYLEVA